MQRYIEQFPAGGEIVIFDRSWYNRAGVEYVMGFCSPSEHKRFLELCPLVEKFAVDGGIILIKLWLEVGMEEQEPASGAHRGSVAAVEAEPDGHRVVRPLVRLFAGARHDVRGDRHKACAMAPGPLRRQAAGTAQRHLAYPQAIPTRRSRGTRSSCRSDPTRAATTIRPACAA